MKKAKISHFTFLQLKLLQYHLNSHRICRLHLVLEYDTSQHRTGSVPSSREYKLQLAALNTQRPLFHSAQSLHTQPWTHPQLKNCNPFSTTLLLETQMLLDSRRDPYSPNFDGSSESRDLASALNAMYPDFVSVFFGPISLQQGWHWLIFMHGA